MLRNSFLVVLLALLPACGGRGGPHRIASGDYRATDVTSDDACHLRPITGDESVTVTVSDTGNTVDVQGDADLGSKQDETLSLSRDGDGLSSSSSYGGSIVENCLIYYDDHVTGTVTGTDRFHLTLDETMTSTGSSCVSLGIPSSCPVRVQADYRIQ